MIEESTWYDRAYVHGGDIAICERCGRTFEVDDGDLQCRCGRKYMLFALPIDPDEYRIDVGDARGGQ